jgi:protease-4
MGCSLSRLHLSALVALAAACLLLPARADTRPAPGIAAQADQPPVVAMMKLRGELLSSPPAMELFSEGRAGTLGQWLQRLSKARNDKDIAAVAIEIDSPAMNWSQAHELAGGIARLRKVKPVYVRLVHPSAADYIAASPATHISIEPSAEIDITGVAAEMMFLRGTLDLVGVQAQMVQIGRFKGAAEPLTSTQPSAELKGEITSLVDDLYEQLTSSIASWRQLAPEEVKAAVDDGPLTAQAAAKARLVDAAMDRRAWERHLHSKIGREGLLSIEENYGLPRRAEIDFSNPFAMLRSIMRASEQKRFDAPAVAIIHIDGVITGGISGETLLGGKVSGARTLVRVMREVAQDPRYVAAVIRIDSPGGSAPASELIYQAVRELSDAKPVVASIGETGASGGYYVALGAPRIYADPSAVTGSIGVVGGKLVFEKLMDKIGLATFSVTRGRNAGLELSRAWTQRELDVVRTLAQRTYDLFVKHVAESRGNKIKNVDSVAQGRVFTGRQAVRNGLVDAVGGLHEAFESARRTSGHDNVSIVYLPRTRTLADLLTGDAEEEDMRMPALGAAEGPAMLAILAQAARDNGVARHLLSLLELLGRERMMAIMPCHVRVKV